MREDEPGRAQGEGRAGEKHVAEQEEVLSYLTDVLRGEAGEELKNSTARMRAAELLGRKLGMFAEAGAEGAMEPAVIVDDVGGARKRRQSDTREGSD